ncbi:sigma-54-dependent Fis family transcriptional regulator [Luteimonas aestuarii]|uniref:Sigma-54-dependent Fis family transcriptional regulator n=1 Tax=Luteimonas aestuarii TaxID=453837 RepID=A0A4R5TT28_9GAMM|nr:sigma-54 dependent transcriptional regulator [Luteimonas aestuarii]TDK22509.1 sigma-54-dependent Fis family transcriptional regulator [Luteimonas aestuarii]
MRVPDETSRKIVSRILVVDDQPDVREALRMLLRTEGYEAVGAASPDEALGLLRGDGGEFAAALVDMNYRTDTTSGEEGLALVTGIAAERPGLPVVAMTAWGSVELAVEAMHRGAADFIEKPWQNARLLNVLESRIALDRSRRGERRLSEAQSLALQDAGDGFVAVSPSMRRLVGELRRIAGSHAGVLLLGENGTGKTLLAQRMHQWSPRRAQPFVKVDVGGLAPTLFESELFGHMRGAFTDARQERAGRFELADGGTLFLDEIGNLPLEQQPKLLRAIEDGEFERLGSARTQRVDVRIIAATNTDLVEAVAAGRFRQDLLYRLNTFQIVVPPLRERSEDIVPLATHYLAAACARYRRPLPALEGDAERALLAYPWPGNVRELAHTMERAALLADAPRLRAADLGLQPARGDGSQAIEAMTLEQAEAWLLRRALRAATGNLQAAADRLGITRQSLYRRLEKHGIGQDGED